MLLVEGGGLGDVNLVSFWKSERRGWRLDVPRSKREPLSSPIWRVPTIFSPELQPLSPIFPLPYLLPLFCTKNRHRRIRFPLAAVYGLTSFSARIQLTYFPKPGVLVIRNVVTGGPRFSLGRGRLGWGEWSEWMLLESPIPILFSPLFFSYFIFLSNRAKYASMFAEEL